jgi:hypothetical protein
LSVYKVCVYDGALILADHEHHIIAPGDVIISDNDIYKGRLLVVYDADCDCHGCPFMGVNSIKSCNLGCAETEGIDVYCKLMPVEDMLEEL